MTLPGGGRQRGGRPREVSVKELSKRDMAILTDLGKLRLLTGRLIERLHFQDGSPLTSSRKSRSCLQRLYELGLVVRLERRIGGIRSGSSGFIYGLSGRGQKLTSATGPAGGTRLRRPWEPSAVFADHVLAVATLYVDLRGAERSGLVEVVDFEAEPACWRHWQGHGGEHRMLKPDCFVHLGSGELEHLAFVEVDRGTESLSVIRRKAEVFVDYWRSGVEQQRLGVFPKVLWLTTTDKRAEQLIDSLARLDPETWQLFQVGRLDQDIVQLIINNQTKGHSSWNN